MIDLAENLPAVKTFDWSNCDHRFVHKNGLTSTGAQRLRCLLCRQDFLGADSFGQYLARVPANEPLSFATIGRIADCVRAGTSAAKCARLISIPLATADKYYRVIRGVLGIQVKRGRYPHL